MLKTRIVTAVILFAAYFCALFIFPLNGWFVFATLVVTVAFWEWGSLMKLAGSARMLLGAAGLAICAGLAWFFPSAFGLGGEFSESAAWHLGRWLYLPAAFFWLLVVPFWLGKRWTMRIPALGLLTGLVVILPAWLALVQLRQLGGLALLAIMAPVWLADTAAYFSGRAFGRHKLAPAISPGKTWEGAIGGGLAVVIYGFVLSPQLPAVLSWNVPLLFFVLVSMAAISIVGDLFESLLKRQTGLKDSSNVLPGHGGVLDRIDSLTSTLPLVALAWLGISQFGGW